MFAAHTTEFRRLRPSRPAAFFAALVVFIIVILVAAPQAQQQALFAPSPSAAAPPRAAAEPPGATEIDLLVGRSTILNVGAPITRVSLTVPDIADALVTTPTQLLIHGKAPGTISLFVWDRGGAIKTYEVNVRRDLKQLAEQMKQLFPGEPITVAGSGKDVVISGIVSGQYVVDKAADVASGYVDKKENVVNLLKQQEGVASNQVMLRVRFAEVSRSALQELGASWFTGPGGFHDYVSRVTTQQFGAPNFDEMKRESIQGADKWGGGRDTVDATGGKQTFSDFLNIFLFNNRYNVGTLIRAMQEKGLFQSLAEPNLIATNGKEASFLAGGEYPYPVVQPGGSGASVTIMFKEFGIRLHFTPTVLGGDLINLKVRPEVSALDFTNAITLEGFRVPALSTRRTETEVELRDGQTFAIAGLLNNTVTDSLRKVPGIGDIPILGWLFKSKALQKNQTELVVMITPSIIKRGQMGVSEALPSEIEPFLGAPAKRLPPPEPYVGSPRYPAPGQTAPRSGGGTQQPGPQPQAAAPAPGQGQQATTAPASVAKPADTNEPLPSHTVVAQPQRLPTPPAQAAETPAPATRPLTKEEKRTLERAREEERRAAEAAEKLRAEQAQRDAEAARVAAEAAERQRAEQARLEAARAAEQARKDAEQKRQAEKLERERAEREAVVARRNAEIAKKKAEQDRKREKALAEAAARLKEAQAAYQAEVDKAKGGTNDKTKDPGKTPPSPAPRD